MKLIFALFKYFPFGGLQKDMLAIAQQAQHQGHSVKIFCREWQGGTPEGIEYEILPANALSNHKKNQQFITALQTRLRHEKYDRLVGFDKIPNLDVYYAADTCFKTKLFKERPFIYRFLPRYKQFLKVEANLFSANSSTTTLALAQPAVNEYIEAYQTPVENFHILPPGISKDRINTGNTKSNLIRDELKLKPSDNILLFIGSGFKTKGLDRAIRALPQLNSKKATQQQTTHLVIAGQDKNNQYKALAKQLNISEQVHFLGGRKDVSELLKSADLLVHPARRENTGTVLLEAAVACLPVICSAACGYSTYIQNNNLGQVIAEPFSQQQFEEALFHALENQTQRVAWQSNAEKFAQGADIYSLPQRAVDIITASIE